MRARAARRARSPAPRFSTARAAAGATRSQAAKSKGTVGPDLDQLRPDAQTVQRQVQERRCRNAVVLEEAERGRRSARSRSSSPSRPGARRWAARWLPASSPTTRRSRTARRPTSTATSRRSRTSRTTTARRRRSTVRPGHQDARADRARLPPDRPRDRRRSALTLPRKHRPGVRRRPPELHVGLLPRDSRARLPRSPAGPARRQGAASSARARRSASPSSSPTSASTASDTG